MALPSIPFLDIVGALAIAVFGGIISRYIHPEVVDLINLIREKTDEIPGWQKMLSVGIGIGVLIAYLPQALSYLLSELERFGIQPGSAVSTEIMLGFAVTAILIFQYRQTSVVRSPLLSIENRLDSLEETIHDSVELDDGSDEGERAETDGGLNDAQDDESDGQDTSGSGMVGGAIAGGTMGSSGGPPGAILGAIIGGVLGDALEQASIENQKRKQIKAKVVRKLMNKRVVYPTQQNIHTILHWFRADEREIVDSGDRSPTGKGRPEYAPAVESETVLGALAGDGQVGALVDRVGEQ